MSLLNHWRMNLKCNPKHLADTQWLKNKITKVTQKTHGKYLSLPTVSESILFRNMKTEF